MGYSKEDQLDKPSKAFYISSPIAQVVLDLLKALAILSIYQKKATFLWVIKRPIINKFFKDFTNHRKKTNRSVVFR